MPPPLPPNPLALLEEIFPPFITSVAPLTPVYILSFPTIMPPPIPRESILSLDEISPLFMVSKAPSITAIPPPAAESSDTIIALLLLIEPPLRSIDTLDPHNSIPPPYQLVFPDISPPVIFICPSL